jgi:hypothetical protein
MQIIFSYLFSILLITSTHAQEDERSWFDFWVGKWEVTWTDANGKQGKGTNTIDKILGNTVIRENFEAHEGQLKGYLGTSIPFTIREQRCGTRDMQTIKAHISILQASVREIKEFLKRLLLKKARREKSNAWCFTTFGRIL